MWLLLNELRGIVSRATAGASKGGMGSANRDRWQTGRRSAAAAVVACGGDDKVGTARGLGGHVGADPISSWDRPETVELGAEGMVWSSMKEASFFSDMSLCQRRLGQGKASKGT
jgi:hypothetical protein